MARAATTQTIAAAQKMTSLGVVGWVTPVTKLSAAAPAVHTVTMWKMPENSSGAEWSVRSSSWS